MQKNKLQLFSLYLILVIAFGMRIFGINWDEGYKLHPDERAIIMAVTNLGYPTSLATFFSAESSWNPHFFAYGSFPFYLLRIVADAASLVDQSLGYYDGIHLVGRFISALFDTCTVLFVFLLGKKLKDWKTGIIAALFYTFSTLAIQLSHFFAVDTLLTFFITLLLYLLLRFYEKPTIVKSLFIGITFGFALATKISATVILVSITAVLFADYFILIITHFHSLRIWIAYRAIDRHYLCYPLSLHDY